MSTRPRTPKYRHQKARGLAVVTLDGQDHFLGPYDSPESWEKYHRLVADHIKRRAACVTTPSLGGCLRRTLGPAADESQG